MADSSVAAVRVRDQYPLVLLIRRGAIRMPAPEGLPPAGGRFGFGV